MRPTELQFRSPKERTAEFNMPVVTKEGTILLPVISKQNHPTFSKSKRFSQYEDFAKITGYRVGPGSYGIENTSIAKSRIKGTHIYRGFHGQKDVTNNGYILVGNQMMFDPSLVPRSRKSNSCDTAGAINPAATMGNATFQRISTASTPSKKRRSISTRPRIVSPQVTV